RTRYDEKFLRRDGFQPARSRIAGAWDVGDVCATGGGSGVPARLGARVRGDLGDIRADYRHGRGASNWRFGILRAHLSDRRSDHLLDASALDSRDALARRRNLARHVLPHRRVEAWNGLP